MSFQAEAFQFNPMYASIDSSKNIGVAYTLSNDQDEPVPVQLTALVREITMDGTEIFSKESDDISIYPPQVILPPKGKRTIRVSFVGNKDIGHEKSYRIFAEEPEFTSQKSEVGKPPIKFKMNYLSNLYVRTSNMKSNVRVKSLTVKDENLEFLIENTGDRHHHLNNLSIIFSNKNKTASLSVLIKNINSDFDGANILAKSERIFKIKRNLLDKSIDSDWVADLSFDQDNE